MRIKENFKKGLYWILRGIVYFVILLLSAFIANYLFIWQIIFIAKITEKLRIPFEKIENSLALNYLIYSLFFLNIVFVLPLVINLTAIISKNLYENLYNTKFQYFDLSDGASFAGFLKKIVGLNKINQYLLSCPDESKKNKYHYKIKKISNFIWRDIRKQFLRMTIYLFILALLCSLENSFTLILSSILITAAINFFYLKIRNFLCKKFNLNEDNLFLIKNSNNEFKKFKTKIIIHFFGGITREEDKFLKKIHHMKFQQIEKTLLKVITFCLITYLIYSYKELEIFSGFKNIESFVNTLVNFEYKFFEKIFNEVPNFMNQDFLSVITHIGLSLCLFGIALKFINTTNYTPKKVSDFIVDKLIINRIG